MYPYEHISLICAFFSITAPARAASYTISPAPQPLTSVSPSSASTLTSISPRMRAAAIAAGGGGSRTHTPPVSPGRVMSASSIPSIPSQSVSPPQHTSMTQLQADAAAGGVQRVRSDSYAHTLALMRVNPDEKRAGMCACVRMCVWALFAVVESDVAAKYF